MKRLLKNTLGKNKTTANKSNIVQPRPSVVAGRSIQGLYAQIAINETGSNPDASPILDIRSNNKGLLVPRLTTIQRNTIP